MVYTFDTIFLYFLTIFFDHHPEPMAPYPVYFFIHHEVYGINRTKSAKYREVEDARFLTKCLHLIVTLFVNVSFRA